MTPQQPCLCALTLAVGIIADGVSLLDISADITPLGTIFACPSLLTTSGASVSRKARFAVPDAHHGTFPIKRRVTIGTAHRARNVMFAELVVTKSRDDGIG
jgi:hypothetical protein